MKKYTEVEIDSLSKRLRANQNDSDVLHQLVGWFKSMCKTEGQSHSATKRRGHGSAFFEAIEVILAADSQPPNA